VDYHEKALDLLPDPLNLSPTAIALLDERERALGIHIPAALRAWYSLAGALRVIQPHPNTDHVLPISQLGRQERSWSGESEDPVTEGLLVLIHENQGACRWAVALDAGDDHPVLVQLTSEGSAWRVYADSLSVFIFTLIWDQWGPFDHTASGCRLQAIGDDADPQILARLRQEYSELYSTYFWPRRFNYRFTDSAGSRILLMEDEHQTDWYVWGSNQMGLRQLLHKIWGYGTVAHLLDPLGSCAAEVLAELRGHTLPQER
jgi:hypothetical protein